MQPKIFNFQHWLDDEMVHTIVTLRHYMTMLLNDSGFEVLNVTDHKFNPQGYTCIWLLGESHLAIHTFPEKDLAYIELSSCVKEPFDLFVKLYMKKFG